MVHVTVFCEDITDIDDIREYLNCVSMSYKIREQTILGIVNGKISMIRFTQEAFVECLEEYYEVHGYNDGKSAILQTARDSVVTRDSIVLTRGVWYDDWIDAELFGGTGSGEKKEDFSDWCEREKGIKFVYHSDFGFFLP